VNTFDARACASAVAQGRAPGLRNRISRLQVVIQINDFGALADDCALVAGHHLDPFAVADNDAGLGAQDCGDAEPQVVRRHHRDPTDSSFFLGLTNILGLTNMLIGLAQALVRADFVEALAHLEAHHGVLADEGGQNVGQIRLLSGPHGV
jgi:hypothetical protein